MTGDSLRAALHAALADADRDATTASRHLERVGRTLREDGATKAEVQTDPQLKDAALHSARAAAFADGVRWLAGRLLVDLLGEEPPPHPGDPGQEPDDG